MKTPTRLDSERWQVRPLQAPAYYTAIGWLCIVVAALIVLAYDQVVIAVIMIVAAVPMFVLARAARRARGADPRSEPSVSLLARLKSVRGLLVYDVAVGVILILAVNEWHLDGSLATIFWMGGFLTTVTAAGRRFNASKDIPGMGQVHPGSEAIHGPDH